MPYFEDKIKELKPVFVYFSKPRKVIGKLRFVFPQSEKGDLINFLNSF